MTKAKQQLYLQIIDLYKRSAEAYQRGDSKTGLTLYNLATENRNKLS